MSCGGLWPRPVGHPNERLCAGRARFYRVLIVLVAVCILLPNLRPKQTSRPLARTKPALHYPATIHCHHILSPNETRREFLKHISAGVVAASWVVPALVHVE